MFWQLPLQCRSFVVKHERLKLTATIVSKISENGNFAYRISNSMCRAVLVWGWRNFRLMLQTLVLMCNKVVPHLLAVDKDLKEDKTEKKRIGWRPPGDSKTFQRLQQWRFNEPFMPPASLSSVTIRSQQFDMQIDSNHET